LAVHVERVHAAEEGARLVDPAAFFAEEDASPVPLFRDGDEPVPVDGRVEALFSRRLQAFEVFL